MIHLTSASGRDFDTLQCLASQQKRISEIVQIPNEQFHAHSTFLPHKKSRSIFKSSPTIVNCHLSFHSISSSSHLSRLIHRSQSRVKWKVISATAKYTLEIDRTEAAFQKILFIHTALDEAQNNETWSCCGYWTLCTTCNYDALIFVLKSQLEHNLQFNHISRNRKKKQARVRRDTTQHITWGEKEDKVEI